MSPLTELFSFATLSAVVSWVVRYYVDTRRQQTARDYEAFDALDEKFLMFQRMCMAYPELDVFDVPDANPTPLTPQQKKQEIVLFTMLFAIFERAYLMYHAQTKKIMQRQWEGWKQYMEQFVGRGNFREAWKVSGQTYDSEFTDFMEGLLGRAG